MALSRCRRTTVLVLVTAALALPAVSTAAPRQAAKTAKAPLSLVDRAWSALQRLWSEAGCIADPNGRCLSNPAGVVHTDAGCISDPSGRCAAVTTRAPQPAPQTDTGCWFDPNGRCNS